MKKKKYNHNKISKTKLKKKERRSMIDQEDLEKFLVKNNYN